MYIAQLSADLGKLVDAAGGLTRAGSGTYHVTIRQLHIMYLSTLRSTLQKVEPYSPIRSSENATTQRVLIKIQSAFESRISPIFNLYPPANPPLENPPTSAH